MKDVPGLALIYVPLGVDPQTTFAGRTLAERARVLAASAGLQPYFVRRPDLATSSGAWIDGGDRLPGRLPPDATVVLWRADVAWVAGVLRALLLRAPVEPAVARDDLGRPAIVVTAAAHLAGGVPATIEAAAHASEPAPDAPASHEPTGRVGRYRLIALGAAVHAEAALVATLDNPRDGVVDRLVNRRLSRRITPAMLSWPITPNQVTALSLAIGILAAMGLAGPGWLWPVAGALLLQLTAVLDCIDGEIARAKVLESWFGELFDVATDSLIHVAVFVGIAVHAWPELGSRTAWFLGASFATGGLASAVVVTRAERSEERWRPVGTWQGRLLARLLGVLTTRDLSALVLAAAVTGLLTPLLVGAAFGAHAFWVAALLLHRDVMRRASRAGRARHAEAPPAHDVQTAPRAR